MNRWIFAWLPKNAMDGWIDRDTIRWKRVWLQRVYEIAPGRYYTAHGYANPRRPS